MEQLLCPISWTLERFEKENFGKVWKSKLLERDLLSKPYPATKFYLFNLCKRRVSFKMTANLLYVGVISDGTGLSCLAENGIVR